MWDLGVDLRWSRCRPDGGIQGENSLGLGASRRAHILDRSNSDADLSGRLRHFDRVRARRRLDGLRTSRARAAQSIGGEKDDWGASQLVPCGSIPTRKPQPNEGRKAASRSLPATEARALGERASPGFVALCCSLIFSLDWSGYSLRFASAPPYTQCCARARACRPQPRVG